MKKYTLLTSILIIVVLLGGCRKIRCIRGNHNIVSETRITNSFSGIELEGSFDVIINYDSTESIIVTAESNIIPYIETSVDGDYLEIKSYRNQCLKNKEPIKIYVNSKLANSIILSGSGDIVCSGYNPNDMDLKISGSGNMDINTDANTLNAEISGSGNINLSGTANKTNFKINGSGNIESYALQQHDCYATVSGSGNIETYVDNYLNAKITGSGNIIYQGNPSVKVNITGSGSVNKF